ncbi:MAG: co-chaperone DjlA [Spongiibacteraceae bacterium]
MIVGKIIGGIIGFFSAGIFGAIIGIFAGHFFDRGVGQAMGFDYGGERARLQRLFFETSFTVMGHIAKADGRITEAEISQAEALMARLGLTEEHRKEAIAFFKQGSKGDFQLEPVIAKFVREGGNKHNLPVLLLEFLFSIALADGSLHESEKQILSRTAEYLGINARQFEQLLAMLTAQQNFSGGSYRGGNNNGSYGGNYQQNGPSRADELENAYKALGVSSSDNDRDIKRAYRKLMSQHHPDKLMSQGVPEEVIKMATAKTQEIQLAYDLIKNSRK